MKDIIFDCIKKTSDVMYVSYPSDEKIYNYKNKSNNNNNIIVKQWKNGIQVCLGLLLAVDPHCRGELLQSHYC